MLPDSLKTQGQGASPTVALHHGADLEGAETGREGTQAPYSRGLAQAVDADVVLETLERVACHQGVKLAWVAAGCEGLGDRLGELAEMGQRSRG